MPPCFCSRWHGVSLRKRSVCFPGARCLHSHTSLTEDRFASVVLFRFNNFFQYVKELCFTPVRCDTGFRLVSRSEEHTSELQSLMRISYAVFCLKKKKNRPTTHTNSIL